MYLYAYLMLAIYLSLGYLIAFIQMKGLEKTINDYENGKELNSNEEELLNTLSLMNKVIGGKRFIINFYLMTMLLWLPTIIHSVFGKKEE